jgi:hypothetical protein
VLPVVLHICIYSLQLRTLATVAAAAGGGFSEIQLPLSGILCLQIYFLTCKLDLQKEQQAAISLLAFEKSCKSIFF